MTEHILKMIIGAGFRQALKRLHRKALRAKAEAGINEREIRRKAGRVVSIHYPLRYSESRAGTPCTLFLYSALSRRPFHLNRTPRAT